MHADPMSLVEKLRELPPERILEVEDFIDFLRSRAERRAQRASLDFPVDHVGRWPEHMSLRREHLYGDDGR